MLTKTGPSYGPSRSRLSSAETMPAGGNAQMGRPKTLRCEMAIG
ncbi:unnamed protein product [Ciceribacter sp. T2.26MG-112.2]|nr:unnamed protein product [Ciceribacter naphthalenivorans]